MNAKHQVAIALAAVALTVSGAALAQTTFQEDFTGATTSNPWYFYNGACLTAGSSSSSASPGRGAVVHQHCQFLLRPGAG